MIEPLKYLNEQNTAIPNRLKWLGEGPWLHEPDLVQFHDNETKYPCCIRRAAATGALCGYVGLSEGHYLHGAEYQNLPWEIEVHGGTTFSGEGSQIFEHPTDFYSKYWVIGFDCAHSTDLSPAIDVALKELDSVTLNHRRLRSTYRDLKYVTEQVLCLSFQLRECAFDRGFFSWGESIRL